MEFMLISQDYKLKECIKMYDCNRCENQDSNFCLHCFTFEKERPPYFKRVKKIDFGELLTERSEIDTGRC